ncbi:MAG: hypothetical protein GX154_01595 [Clostridiales bacterium]|jgi:hypothetical protein|nr:hypothetical protein [Clostridiales bacterium]
MKKCSQCGKVAMYKIEGGHLLCLDCFHKHNSIVQQQIAQLTAEENFLIGQMEAIAGLPLTFPRHEIPQPSPVINRNINISNSTIGAVNTGYIKNLKVNLKHMVHTGNQELAEQLQVFTKQMLKEDFTIEIKNEILEQLEFLSQQLSGQELPKRGIIKSILNSVLIAISTSESLINIWNTIQDMISNLMK